MSSTPLRTIFIAFLLTLVIWGTLIGLAVAAFNTQSAMTPMDTPASAQISENGEQYEISFFDQRFSLPRLPMKEGETILNRYPILIPKPIIFIAYGINRVSDYLK